MPEQQKEIIVYIKADGTVVHTVNGAVGTECDALTRPLEEALGGTVTNRSNKSEYYEGDGGAAQTVSTTY